MLTCTSLASRVSDFESTLLKTAVWRELAGRYDQVAFIDADTILVQNPDRERTRLKHFGVKAASRSPL